jgi:hypothetical protein
MSRADKVFSQARTGNPLSFASWCELYGRSIDFMIRSQKANVFDYGRDESGRMSLIIGNAAIRELLLADPATAEFVLAVASSGPASINEHFVLGEVFAGGPKVFRRAV